MTPAEICGWPLQLRTAPRPTGAGMRRRQGPRTGGSAVPATGRAELEELFLFLAAAAAASAREPHLAPSRCAAEAS